MLFLALGYPWYGLIVLPLAALWFHLLRRWQKGHVNDVHLDCGNLCFTDATGKQGTLSAGRIVQIVDTSPGRWRKTVFIHYLQDSKMMSLFFFVQRDSFFGCSAMKELNGWFKQYKHQLAEDPSTQTVSSHEGSITKSQTQG